MAMNISCKFEKASYNIFFVRAVTVKSKDSQAMISYRLVYHPKPLGPIISEL